MRQVVNAIFYLGKSGGQWRMLPKDLPHWKRVYHYFNTWRKTGVWQALNSARREQVRQQAGRERTPSAAIIDSQSVKTTAKGGRAASMAASTSKGANAI